MYNACFATALSAKAGNRTCARKQDRVSDAFLPRARHEGVVGLFHKCLVGHIPIVLHGLRNFSGIRTKTGIAAVFFPAELIDRHENSSVLLKNETSVDFNSDPDVYVKAEVTSDDPDLQASLDACNNFTKASITYTFGDETVTLDGSTIKDWLNFDEKGQLIRDDASFQQHIADYVAQLAASHDTVGTEREFHTTSGRTVYVYGSAYGWQIDQASEVAQLTQEIQSGTQTVRDPVYSMTANSYGVNDLGNTYIEVDLSEQHMYYYQDGAMIFDSDFVSGNMSYDDRQTHAGIFTMYYKKSPDVLRGSQKADGTYEYESEVQYWMPFDGGIGFHDASWRDEFGGDIYLTDGSHGCINLPPDNAAVLYDIIQYGVPIVCFY